MTTGSPVLTTPLWRSRHAAAIAGIVFAVLLLAALVMTRIALGDDTLESLRDNADRRAMLRFSLNLVPFAGIAFLWFIGVIRDRLGKVEDRLFSTVFLGSGLLFLAMLFVGAGTTTSLMGVLTRANVDVEVFAFGNTTSQALISVYAMRMAAVFTLSVSTVGLRTKSLPRWVCYLGYLVGLMLILAAAEFKWAQLVFPVWVLLVSVALLFARSTSPDDVGTSTSPATPSG
jgi:hypothetical protein